jgi:aquaporin PIP
MGVEFGCTFLLVMTVMAATDSERAKTNPHISIIAPLVVGLAVTVAHFVAIPVDNCSINPARSFGVSIISGNFNDHHVFWFGPYLGAIAAALVYTVLLAPQKEAHPIASLPFDSDNGKGVAEVRVPDSSEALPSNIQAVPSNAWK